MTFTLPSNKSQLDKEFETLVGIVGKKLSEGKLEQHFFANHAELSAAYKEMAGLSHSFLRALMHAGVEDFLDDLAADKIDFADYDEENLGKAAFYLLDELVVAAYEQSQALRNQDWPEACGPLDKMQEMSSCLNTIYLGAVNAPHLQDEFVMDLFKSVVESYNAIKLSQLELLCKAPLEAIKYAWSGETAETISAYADLLTKLADERKDPSISGFITGLVKSAQAPVKTPVKKPRAPKNNHYVL